MKRFLLIFAFVLAAAVGTVMQAQDAPAVIEISGDDAELPLGKGLPVVVDCSATWCGPCKAYWPDFQAVAEENRGKAIFVHIDVDECALISYTYQIEELPTTLIFDAAGNMKFNGSNVFNGQQLKQVLADTLGW